MRIELPQVALREPRSLAERAYQNLVWLITRLELPPGSVLVEKNVMAELGIGRTPVREALQRLSNEGLVVHQPNRGMFVSEITAPSVQAIYEFRSLIDGHLVRLAAERANEAQAATLETLYGEFVHASVSSDIDSVVAIDRQFYAVLSEAAQNIYLAEVIPRIFNLHLRLWFYIASRRGGWADMTQALTDMAGEVARAIAAHDPDQAERAVRNYISQRHADMRDLL